MLQNNKVAELNLEYGKPAAADALAKMSDSLLTYKKQGIKAVILIHGYGSSGTGGSIKAAVRKRLGEPALSGIVRAYTGGEQWAYRKKEFLGLCGSLGSFERRISGNEGITVVILK
jgi:hypothetical protein